MNFRSKVKDEKELVIQINKFFNAFCIQLDCSECPIHPITSTREECRLEYVKNILLNYGTKEI